jgi:hypothetical protein
MLASPFPRRALPAVVLCLIASPFPARAAITPEAQAVLERYVAAIGGRAAFVGERNTYTRNRISAFGFEGIVEAWTQRPDKAATRTALGPLTLRDGFDGAVAWRVDQNGKLAKRDGRDLDNARGQAWFENERWLEPDQGGGTVRVKSAGDSAGAFTVLEVVPPAGRPNDMWFNRETGLIDRTVVVNDQQTVTTRFSDYRRLFGRLRPHRQDGIIQNMPANTIVITLDSMAINQPVDPAIFAMPAEAAAADVRYLKAPGAARLPLRYGERHLWLKVSVNGGEPQDFLLDTGASVSLLDSAWAAANGIPSEGKMQAMGAGASGDVAFTRVASLRLAGPDGDGVELTDQKLAVLSLNRWIAPFFWREAAGVLGYDFISRFVMRVDYDSGVLTLSDPKTFQYQGKGVAVPLTLAGAIPVVKAKLDGRYEGEFRLDVGSGSTVDLHSPFVKQHDLRGKTKKTVEVLNGGFGGTFTSHLARMKKIEIGPYSWTDPLVILSGAETGGLASSDFAGNIGNELLDRFVCTFDYEHRMLYLEPGKNYGKRDQFSRAGLQLARFGDVVKAMQVLPGSAAAAAGLKEGDEVTSVDGKPILTYVPDQLNEMFEQGAVGKTHTIEVMRDGRKVAMTLKLKEMI